VRKGLLGGHGNRPGESRKRSRKGLLIGGAAAVLVALGLTSQFNFETPNDTEVREQARGPVTIGAEALHRAYRDDPGGAGDQYDNREMVVSGEFLRIVPDGYGSLDLRLKTSDPADQLGIDVADLAIEDAKQLRPGQRVTVSCQRMGSGDDVVWVQDCAIQQTGGLASPAAPAPPPAPDMEID
jgi:hypothetical protein